ncbi:MAG: CocE/NonD family hydrolase [Actinomycetota bacterium]
MTGRSWVRRALLPALTAAVLAATGVAQAGNEEPYETTEGQSQPKYDESVVEEYRVQTKWGKLYGVIERPVVPEGLKVPVILTYTPYTVLDGPTPIGFGDSTSDYFVPRGYARAIFDLVGTNGSTGCYDYGGIRERESGAELVDALGEMEWSNGRVGMIGGSYDGTTQWAAAVETPKHLTTIVPQVAIGRWYDYTYGQGVRFASGSGTPLLFDYGFGFIPPTHGGPPDPEAPVDHIRPCERMEHNQRAFLPDPVYDKFWDERDYLKRIHKVRASVMIEGSWVDYNVHPVNSIEMWMALPQGHPKRLVMAQQGHGAANLPDSINIRHAWFDYWLLGLNTGVMDLPQVDSLANNQLRFQSEQWPPPASHTVAMPLVDHDADGSLTLLDAEEPVWIDDNPVLSDRDVLADEGGTADLLFVGQPMDHDVRIAGIPVLDVKVVTSAANTWVTPVIFAEDANGNRRMLARGLLNARNRFGERKSVPLKSGRPWSGSVKFQPVDYVLSEGSRLGVAVMSMNGNEALYWGGSNATNELRLNGSRLLLPLASTTSPTSPR